MTFTLDKMAYEALLGNPNITEEVIDTLLSSRPNKWILEATADSEKANEAQLELVYKKSKSYGVLYNLALNPKTPVDVLESLFKEYKDEVCTNIQIPNHLVSKITQVKKLSKKAQEDFDRSCSCLARNPALSDKKDQLILAKKMSKPENLFFNPNLHGEVFEYLWASGVTQWASSFTESKNFSEKHAIIMLTSDDEMIRAAVVRSQHGPKDVVLKARKDSSGRVREAAFTNPLFFINYADLDYTDLSAILGVVRRDDVPEEVLIKIAELEFPSHSNIKFVLARKNVPLSVLEILFSQGVVASSNPNLSEEMLEHCITKGSDWDRYFALRNPKISLVKIKTYLGLDEKFSGESAEVPFYKLPDWYKQVTNAIDQLPHSELGLEKSPVPRVFIPNLADAIDSTDEILGVIGGYFYKSDRGDKRIRQGFAQPVVQINLDMLSRKTGTNYGDKILQVWGHHYDWGQGVIATCDTVDIKDVTTSSDGSFFKVDEPSNLMTASQYDKAIACFDWTDSTYTNDLGLRTPIFIVGVEDAGLNVRLFDKQQEKLFSEMMKTLNFDAKKYEEFFSNEPSYVKDTVFKDGIAVLNGIMHIQKFRLNTSFGNFNEENLMRSGSWLPLFTLCGPLDDPIEDFYTIFYSKTKEGDYKYKAKAHRWCY